MNIHAENTRDNKNRSVANGVAQKQKSNAAFQFMDDRPEAVEMRKLQETINNSPRVKQLRTIQEMALKSPGAERTAQLQAMADSQSISGRQQPVQRKENNTGLPDNLKSGIENLSGYSMNDVKVHYNSGKPAQLQAHAFAQGTDIHVAPGQEKHLPHEAWHVVQQKQGRVQPTLQMKDGVSINNDAGLEAEADRMGDNALQRAAMATAEIQGNENKHTTLPFNLPVQRVPDSVEDIVLRDDEMGDARRDVNIAMAKIKAAIQRWAAEEGNVVGQLQKTGRDAWVYAGFFARKNTLQQHLDNWDDSWSLENTCGLLLDLGNSLRNLCPKEDVMNKTMKKSRSQGDGHDVNMESDWATEFVPEGTKMKSGVSATTGNLLRTLRSLNVTTSSEIEAIMIGVVKYWKDGSIIKRIMGDYHTAAEVWSAYTFHLEEYVMKKDKEEEM